MFEESERGKNWCKPETNSMVNIKGTSPRVTLTLSTRSCATSLKTHLALVRAKVERGREPWVLAEELGQRAHISHQSNLLAL